MWWYSDGLRWIWSRAVADRLKAWAAYFSVASLVKTIFAPYKQTFAGGSSGSIGVKFRAWVDRTVSRFVGLLIRSLLILAWSICSLATLATGAVAVIVWPLLPVFPLASLVIAMLR